VSLRLPEGHTKAFYEAKRELDKLVPIEEDLDSIPDVWEYAGATITKGYAEVVVVPSGYEIK
jgi:hypothetical protein